jgi:hypothetical protein
VVVAASLPEAGPVLTQYTHGSLHDQIPGA